MKNNVCNNHTGNSTAEMFERNMWIKSIATVMTIAINMTMTLCQKGQLGQIIALSSITLELIQHQNGIIQRNACIAGKTACDNQVWLLHRQTEGWTDRCPWKWSLCAALLWFQWPVFSAHRKCPRWICCFIEYLLLWICYNWYFIVLTCWIWCMHVVEWTCAV